MQKLSGLQVGDTVKVLRGWKMGEFGFNRSHIGYYQKVNEINTIKEVTDLGIAIEKNGATYPFFVLELVSKADTIMLNDKTAAIIQPDGNVTVGLEIFKKEAVLALALRIQMKLELNKKKVTFPYVVDCDKVPVGAIFEYNGNEFKQLREWTGKEGDVIYLTGSSLVKGKKTLFVANTPRDTVKVISHGEEVKIAPTVPYITTPDEIPVGSKFRLHTVNGLKNKTNDRLYYKQLRKFRGMTGDIAALDENDNFSHKTYVTTKDQVATVKVEVVELKS